MQSMLQELVSERRVLSRKAIPGPGSRHLNNCQEHPTSTAQPTAVSIHWWDKREIQTKAGISGYYCKKSTGFLWTVLPKVACRGLPLLKFTGFSYSWDRHKARKLVLSQHSPINISSEELLPSMVSLWHCCLFWGKNVLHVIHSESGSQSNILCFFLGVSFPLPPSWESDGISFALDDSQFGFRTMWTYRGLGHLTVPNGECM